MYGEQYAGNSEHCILYIVYSVGYAVSSIHYTLYIFNSVQCRYKMFTRPCVARAALGTPLLLINSLTQSVIICKNIFKTLPLPNHESYGVEVLNELSPPNMCHMSHVTYHVSCVTCYVCHRSLFVHIFLACPSS